MSCGTALE